MKTYTLLSLNEAQFVTQYVPVESGGYVIQTSHDYGKTFTFDSLVSSRDVKMFVAHLITLREYKIKESWGGVAMTEESGRGHLLLKLDTGGNDE